MAEGAPGQPPAAPAFRHDDPGTSESTWLLAPSWDGVTSASPAAWAGRAERVVVLAAHPDDETLGVGGLLHDLAAAEYALDVVVATDGEASHPASGLWTPARLAGVRRAEVTRAVRRLAPHARLHHLGLPDGGLAALATVLDAALATVVGSTPPAATVLLAPFDLDGHPDHDALGAAAGRWASATGGAAWHYPIWRWHWDTPAGLPWARLVQVMPSAAAQHAKAEAVADHATQVAPLSPLPGDEVLLGPLQIARFARVVETLVAGVGADVTAVARAGASAEEERRRARVASFEGMYDAGPDPWRSTSWYERRKHALTCAVLGRERYGRALEVGCATGALTAHLGPRVDELIATDVSPRALDVARTRAVSGVSWRQAEAPAGLPDEAVDLVVLSEVGYFLTGAELLGLLRHAARVLRPGGELVLVDWRHRTEGLPLDGELVHRQARAALGAWTPGVAYRDEDVLIETWFSPGT